MKKTNLMKIMAVIVAAMLIFTACAGSNEVEKETFVLGLDDSFPPMGYRDDNNEIVGYDIDIAKEVCERLGMELVLQPIEWANKENELNAGNVDVIWNGMTITEQRQQDMLMTAGYIENSIVLVVKDDSGISAKADLAGKSIGVQTGSSGEEALSKDAISSEASEIIQGADYVTLLADLEIGRIDAVAIDVIVANYYITDKEYPFTVIDEKLAPEEYGIGFQKDNQELYDKVVGALNEMKEDGTWAEISNTWFGTDTIIF